MLYVIFAEDHPNSFALRQVAVNAHRERLQQLQNQGQLILAGPLPVADCEELNSQDGMQGSLIVAEFDSLESARNWAAADPYLRSGVYKTVKVTPMVPMFPLAHSSSLSFMHSSLL